MGASRILAVWLAVLSLLGGCASVPMGSDEEDAAAKKFAPRTGAASLYIYRNETFGAAIPMSVAVNGKMLGQTAAQTYFHLSLRPGDYLVESHAENVSSLALSLEENRNYYVWQEVKMGFWMARSLLQQVDDAKGRAGVAESKLIKLVPALEEIQPRGASIPATGVVPDPGAAQRLRELDKLRQEGVISEDEYQSKRKAVMERL